MAETRGGPKPKTEEEIRERVISLNLIYDKHKVNWGPTQINQHLVRHCVEAYFDDLYRIKSFHGYELGDRHKKAGFTMKWISKIKPLQLTTQDPIDRYAFLVNERFALAVSLPFLDYEQEAEPAISPNFIENLLFSLHYREHDSEVLAILAYLLECSINQETP